MNQNTKLNGLILPAPLLDEINEASNYFGSCFESMIFNSIEKNLLDKDQKVITALNESFQKMTYIKNTLKNNEKFIQNLEESDSANLDLSCTFWGKIEKSLGKKLSIVIEADESTEASQQEQVKRKPKREQIEGDGESIDSDEQEQEGHRQQRRKEHEDGSQVDASIARDHAKLNAGNRCEAFARDGDGENSYRIEPMSQADGAVNGKAEHCEESVGHSVESTGSQIPHRSQRCS
mgnify:CR=1 FL=1